MKNEVLRLLYTHTYVAVCVIALYFDVAVDLPVPQCLCLPCCPAAAEWPTESSITWPFACYQFADRIASSRA